MSWRALLPLLIVFGGGLVLGVIVSLVFFLQQTSAGERVSAASYNRDKLELAVLPKQFDLNNMESKKYLYPEYVPSQKQIPFDHPAHLRQEYKLRKTVFVGVLSSQMYLPTRAKAMYETWAVDVSMLVFFVGADCIVPPELAHLPIIKLHGVPDGVYPPLKKAFAVMQYMYDHFVDDYDWFIRADDDVYVRGKTLTDLLHSMDPTELVSLGRAGEGKTDDFERLKLLKHEKYCMGGPGMIFSRALMVALGPYLQLCLEAILFHDKLSPQFLWNDDDVEIGRCLSRELGVQCSTSHEGRLYFIYDYDEESLQTKLLWSKPEFREAITIHPIKDPDHIRAVHLFYKTLEYEQLFLSKQATQRTVTSLCKQLPAELVPLGLLKDECNIPFSTTHTYTVASTAVQKKRVHKHHNVGKRKL